MAGLKEFYQRARDIRQEGTDENLVQSEFDTWWDAQTDTTPFISVARLNYKGTDLFGWITTPGPTVGVGKLVLPMGLDGMPLKYPGLEWVLLANRNATGWHYRAEDMFRAIGLTLGHEERYRTETAHTDISGVAFTLVIESLLPRRSQDQIQWEPPDIRRAWLALSAMEIAKDIQYSFPMPEDAHITPVPVSALLSSKPPSGVLYG